LTFLIKRYDAGNASKHIHGLKAGDSLSIKGPFEKFLYKSVYLDLLTHMPMCWFSWKRTSLMK
jgi:NAD(P)H-flavin reductase